MDYYRHGTSFTKIVTLAGVGYGMINWIYRQIITIIQKSNLRLENVKWPIRKAKKTATDLVKNQVQVLVRRDRFYMTDEILIPLYCKPLYYGKMFYNLKSQYLINV